MAQNLLGIFYLDGTGVQQNYSQALYWFEKAAIQNDPDAQYNLGRLYYEGKGVPQDYAQAHYWLKKAADQHPWLADDYLFRLEEAGY